MQANLFLKSLTIVAVAALLTQQTSALAQQPREIAPPATPAPPAAPPALRHGTIVEVTLLDSLTSATAVQGQPVRLAVAKDVRVHGSVVIPRGTPVKGIVAEVEKAAPGYRGGLLTILPQEIDLPNGSRLAIADKPHPAPCCENSDGSGFNPATALLLGPVVALMVILLLTPLAWVGGVVLLGLLAYGVYKMVSGVGRVIADPRSQERGPRRPRPGIEMVLPICTSQSMQITGPLTPLPSPAAPQPDQPAALAQTINTFCPATP